MRYDKQNDHFDEAIDVLANWIRNGDLVHNEHILQGAAAAPSAINMLYEVRNTGKLLIRVD